MHPVCIFNAGVKFRECMNFPHRCKILYTPDYTKITNLFLMKLSKKTKNKKQKKQGIEKNAILFSILHILHILLFIIIKFYVNVSFHIILLLCVVQTYFFFFNPGVNGLAGVRCYLHPGN